jgi:processive 1,2-diacylglycerol beta-glucosyltransferase
MLSPGRAASRGLPAWDASLAWLLPPGAERVLLATLGFGDGHNRAAQALAALCRRLRPEVETRVADALEASPSGPWQRRRAAYYAALRSCPRAYHAAYAFLARWRWPLDRLARSLEPWLQDQVRTFRPQIVVSTHVFCARAAERTSEGVAFRTAGVVTDLLDDAYWNLTRLDRYLVATPELADRLARAGLPRDAVRVTGLPVDPAFHEPLPREEARRRLGLDPGLFTVLSLGGGAGFGALGEAAGVLAQADLPIQIVAVAGRNEALRSRLELQTLTARAPLHVVGFTDRMPEYLAAADLVVTKPGGMTVAECLARAVPMVLLGRPLPGPETLNYRWLVETGKARTAADARALLELIGTEPMGPAATTTLPSRIAAPAG